MDKFFRTPFAQSGDTATIPDAVDPSGNVSYTQGYGFDYQRQKTDPAAKNIERDKMNGLFFSITNAVRELQSQGIPDFITSALNGGTAYSYSQNAVVRYNNQLYVSLADSNTALPTDATKWALFGATQFISNVATLRSIAPANTRMVQTLAYATAGDGGGGLFYAKTGAAPGTYVDDGGSVIVPTGGDGSAAWILTASGGVYSPRQFGITTDMTDAAGDNHTKLVSLAKAAIRGRADIFIDVRVLVSDRVNWDTRTSAFNNLDPLIPNGLGKNLNVRMGSGAGIYGKASAFSGAPSSIKDVVTYCGQQSNAFHGRVQLWQDGAVSYTTLRNACCFHAKNTDRLDLQGVFGGLVSSSAVDLSAGISVWLEDCMSPRVPLADILYYSRYGIAIDGGSSFDPLPTTEVIRVSTSGRIGDVYFGGGGYPLATSRNECTSITPGYGYTMSGCIFEEANKGRSWVPINDGVTEVNCWHEGIYSTALLNGSFGHTLIGADEIRFSPTNGWIEGVSTYSIPGALAVGTPSTATVNSCLFLMPGFYQPRFQIPAQQTVRGNLSVIGNLLGTYFAATESAGDINAIFGAPGGPVINDQTTVQAHSPVGGAVRYRGSVSGDPTNSSNFVFDLLHNPLDANNGFVQEINVNKGMLIRFLGADGYFFANSGFGKYFCPTNDNLADLGRPSNRFKVVYAGTGTINTSDENAKTDVDPIDPRAIKAWAKVEFKQFRFKDAVAAKGRNARLHVGVIAQRVKEAFESEGLDPFAYGILCYDEWDEQTEEITREEEYLADVVTRVPFDVLAADFDEADETVEDAKTYVLKVRGADGELVEEERVRGTREETRQVKKTRVEYTGEHRVTRPAGQIYGVRENEAFWLEMAYLRSRLK